MHCVECHCDACIASPEVQCCQCCSHNTAESPVCAVPDAVFPHNALGLFAKAFNLCTALRDRVGGQ